MTSQFKDKVYIVTGASAGVGAACARALAKEKAKLVLLARGQAALDDIKKELEDQTEVLCISMDVADSQAGIDMLEQTQKHFGAIHGLINNAGFHTRGPVDEQDPADLAKMVDVNLRAPIELSARILPYIKQSGGGAIVNVGSLAGRTPLQGAATYAATKAGLRAFAYSMSDELLGSGVNIGVVSPGPIDTGFIMDDIDDVEDIVFSQPMSTADEVADAVLQVASGKQVEVAMPAASGWLTTVSYLMPDMRRRLRPALYARGRKAKEKYRKRNQNA